MVALQKQLAGVAVAPISAFSSSLKLCWTHGLAQVFIGIARKDDAKDYLRNTAYATVSDIDDRVANYVEHSGAAPTSTPASADMWVAQSSGTGTQSLTWTPKGG